MRFLIFIAIVIVALAAPYAAPQNASAQLIPAAVITPDDIEFEDTLVGQTSAQQIFTVTKTRSILPLYIFSASLADSVNFAIASDGCSGRTLEDGQSCEIAVNFSPGQAARFVTTMTLIDLGRNIIDTAGLSGRGVAPAVTLSTTNVDFGDQTVNMPSSSHEVLIVNTGTADLNVSSITSTGDFGQTNDCGDPVVPNDLCKTEITFTPSALGAATGTVTITDDASDSPQTVALQGIGIPPGNPDVSLSTHVLDFGSMLVGSASDHETIVLVNVGTVNLNVANIVASGDFSQTNDCPAIVAPDANCSINAVFEPTTTGVLEGAITITDDATDSPQTVSLSGRGVSPDTPHME
ncbi:MAG: choice-of-anchor D domain-containing protein, partial [candidate division Zixibacteria bacterium]|nr:choice-of-anchor D domain-containing protein [candidate division Zixibacteria bacterium]